MVKVNQKRCEEKKRINTARPNEKEKGLARMPAPFTY